VAATIAADLLCWLRLLCLDGPLAKAEPKTLRYRLLHTAARIVRGQRKRTIPHPRNLALGNTTEGAGRRLLHSTDADSLIALSTRFLVERATADSDARTASLDDNQQAGLKVSHRGSRSPSRHPISCVAQGQVSGCGWCVALAAHDACGVCRSGSAGFWAQPSRVARRGRQAQPAQQVAAMVRPHTRPVDLDRGGG